MFQANLAPNTCLLFRINLLLTACDQKQQKVTIEYVDYINYEHMGIENKILTQNYLISGDEKQFCQKIDSWIQNRSLIYKEILKKDALREIHLFFYKKSEILTLENRSVSNDFEFESLHFLSFFGELNMYKKQDTII